MKRIVLYIAALCATLMLPTYVRADFSHNFQSKMAAGTLETVDATHVRSTNDDIVYTLSNCEFYYDIETHTSIALNLFTKYGYVIISPVDKLSELIINHYSNLEGNTLSSSKLLIQLSKDGSNWISITPTVTYDRGSISVVAPYQDSYYVKITSRSNTQISILQIDYIITDCNCFRYTP